ncbi:hypothetical protein HGA64_02520 [Candidatus Falkowbacteria bacterium]|nr:hypothetical protein [Candidatus Falkowbacteria bacterium]
MNNYVYLGTSQGIYKSTDYGYNWTLINSGLTNFNITSIEIAYVYSGGNIADANTEVYVATANGIFKSTLGGSTWTKLPDTNTLSIKDLKIDRYKSGGADASSFYFSTSTGGVYRSDDAGASISLQSAGLGASAVKKMMTDFMVGNIYGITSANEVVSSPMFSNGSVNESWSVVYSTTTNINNISINNSFGGLYLSTDNGLYHSSDNGSTWTWLSDGMADTRINSLATDYNGQILAFAASRSGAYFSVDSDSASLGSAWANANLGMGNASLLDVVTNPGDSSYVYAISSTSVYRLNFSNVGNATLGMLATSDIIAPGQITDLSASNATVDSVDLGWAAPGDDAYSGTASSYDIRYSTSTIDDSNWNVATRVTNEPAPQTAGSPEHITISGLDSDTTYYFAIVTIDSSGNVSTISNIITVTTSIVDIAAPTVTAFVMPASSASTTVSVTSLTANDNVAVTRYLINESSSTPNVNDANWSASAPTAYIFSGAGSRTAYAWAKDAAGNISTSSSRTVMITLPDIQAPTVPSGLAVSTSTSNSMTLLWDASTDNVGVAGYRIYRATSTGSLSQIGTTTNSTYTDNTNKSLTSYVYSVSAYDAAGNTSANSATTSSTTLPSIPSGFAVRSATGTSITLGWSTSTEALSYYFIYRNGTQVGTTSSAVGTYIDSGLVANTAYNYGIRAFANPSYLSAVATTTGTIDSISPSVPGGLTTGTTSASVINIAWIASTDNVGVVGYKIYRATGTNSLVQVATSTVNSYSDAGLSGLTRYVYGIAAYDLAGNTSATSATTSTSTLPSTPSGFGGSGASINSNNLYWTASTEPIAYFILYRGGLQIATTTPSTTGYVDTGLGEGTQYTYSLRAYASSTSVSADSVISVTTKSNVVSGGGGGGGASSVTTCSSWTYSVWSVCSNGTQTRSIMTSSPTGCSGGSPVLTQTCTASTSTSATSTSTASAASTTTTVITPATTTTSASTAATLTDSDKDGIVDDMEVALGINPLKADTDGDGFNDKQELLQDFSPLLVKKKIVIDSAFAKKSQGKIFLQVQSKGQAWYINPKDLKRYYLGRPNDAFTVMRRLGLGVKHEVIVKNKIYSAALSGKILLDVEDKGKAYYINPKDRKAYYLGRPSDAFAVMRKLGIGITTTELDRISVGLF